MILSDLNKILILILIINTKVPGACACKRHNISSGFVGKKNGME